MRFLAISPDAMSSCQLLPRSCRWIRQLAVPTRCLVEVGLDPSEVVTQARLLAPGDIPTRTFRVHPMALRVRPSASGQYV